MCVSVPGIVYIVSLGIIMKYNSKIQKGIRWKFDSILLNFSIIFYFRSWIRPEMCVFVPRIVYIVSLGIIMKYNCKIQKGMKWKIFPFDSTLLNFTIMFHFRSWIRPEMCISVLIERDVFSIFDCGSVTLAQK